VVDTFEALPEEDQRSVVLEILRRTAEDYPPIDELELVLAADQIFGDLDRREGQD
jgi:hypothetical protein